MSPDSVCNAPAAILLAGGRSLRMGGGDKSLRLLGGRPLLAHVLGRMSGQAGAIAISANGDPARFAAFGLQVLADALPDHRGPLAGLLAGMRWAAALGTADIVSVPADTPFVPPDLVTRLAAAAVTGAPALAGSNGRRHPAVGLWPVDLAARLENFLLAGKTFKVSAFAESCGAVLVDFPMIALAGGVADPFFNVNSPGDLALAEQLMAEIGP